MSDERVYKVEAYVSDSDMPSEHHEVRGEAIQAAERIARRYPECAVVLWERVGVVKGEVQIRWVR